MAIDPTEKEEKRGETKPIGRVVFGSLLALVGLFLCGRSCLWVVEPNEQGVVTRWGRVARVVPSGLHLSLPWPAETMRKVATTDVRRIEVGVDTSSPIPRADESLWLSANTNIVKLSCTIQYLVSDPTAYLFAAEVVESSERLDDLALVTDSSRALVWIGECVLTEVIAQTPIDTLISVGKASLAQEVKERVEDQVEAFGLGYDIVSVSLSDVSPPDRVIAAFNDVVSAETDRITELTKAKGYRLELVPQTEAEVNRIKREAEREAEREMSEAHAAANRFLALSQEIRNAPDVTLTKLWTESLSRMLDRARIHNYESLPGRKYLYTVIE